MIKLILSLMALVFSKVTFSQFSPSNRMFENTILFRSGNSIGTCFIVSYLGKEYLITAKHIFNSDVKSGSSQTIYALIEGREVGLKPTIFFHQNSEVDVAVMDVGHQLSNNEIDLNSDGVTYLGQDLLFLGFPFGIRTIFDSTHIIPFVKKAYLSGQVQSKGAKIELLDGHNNKGFSGGPVIAQKRDGSQYFFGVISGYLNDPQNLSTEIENKKIDFVLNTNSGIIKAFGIYYVKEIIENIK